MEQTAPFRMGIYAGYVTDTAQLLQCTSGGIATALSIAMIRSGGYVAGVEYSEDFRYARYRITNEEAVLERFRGSKYVEVRMGSVYRDVKALLEQGERVLFIGLPCTVAALKNSLGKDYDRLLTAELICHGPAPEAVHRQYVEYLEKKHRSKLTALCARKKLTAWTPVYLYAEFENGKKFLQPFYETEYGDAFIVTGKPACYRCAFLAKNRKADIVLADCWGAEPGDPFWNEKGVSTVLTMTERGERYLKSIPDIALFPTTAKKATAKNYYVVHTRYVHKRKQEFDRLMEERGLIYASWHSRSFQSRCKMVLRRLIPRSFQDRVRQLSKEGEGHV